MKEEFATYIKSLGIRTPLGERVQAIYQFLRGLCPDEITGMFIEDYFKENGTREFEGLWLFSQKYVMEAKTFITTDDFDMTPLEKSIRYCRISKQDYDFQEATEKSRMSLYAIFGANTAIADIKAAKDNCNALRDIFLKYFLPNVTA